MATNIDQPGAADVANSLLFGDERRVPQRVGKDAREGSIWPLIGPTVLVLALLVLATAYAGAFNIAQWAPPTLFIVLTLFTLLVRDGLRAPPDRWLGLTLAGAWGLAGWAMLSALWAGSAGGALEGAGKLAMYAAILTLPLVATGDSRSLRVAARGVIIGIALIGLYTLVRMFADGPSIFLAGRLNGPVEYRNATALLFCVAYWPLLVTAATREGGRAVRALCFGLAVLMLGLAFLTQSRGVLIGLGCGALVVFLLGPERLRRAWMALLSVLLIACASHWLLTPYHAFAGGGQVSAGDITTAAAALLATALAGGAVGFLVAVFDAGLRPASDAMTRMRGFARAGLVVVALVALVGGAVAVRGDPLGELQAKWREFKSLKTTTPVSTRYASVGGQRYDLWRVALHELGSHPVAGVGEGSYEFGYYRLRRTDRNLTDPHGLLFQLGAELGVVGLLLFAAVVVGLIGSLRRWWPRAPIEARRTACGLAAAGATFIGQSLVDWIWRVPGLTSLGVLCLGVAAALLASASSERSSVSEAPPAGGAASGSGPPADASGSRRSGPADAGAADRAPRGGESRRRLGRTLAGAGLLAVFALVLSLYLSDFYVRRARDERGRSPAGQLDDARVAAALDPFAVQPHYLEASALESMGRRAAARAELVRAQRIEPHSLVPLGLLGDLEARGGNFVQARVYYRRALARDPLDVGLQQLAHTGGRS
jgi:hypothetical protein